MSLLGCPNEILEQILSEISSDDIENFSSTCKLLRILAERALKEHFKLKSQYGYKINYPSQKALHPAEILDALIENPKAAHYIKALSLTYRRRTSSNEREVNAIITRRDGFMKQLQEVPWICDGEVMSWYNRIINGHVDSMFALLLCYLHNLRELRIQRPILIPITSVIISRLKSSVARLPAILDTETRTPATSPFASTSLANQLPSFECEHPPGLSKLERVMIDPATCAEDMHLRSRLGDFARFASFSSFPYIQHLNGISLISRKYNLDQNFSGFAGLRSIRLVNCNIAPEAFRSLFAGIIALESFHYTPTEDVKEFRLTPVVEDLKKYASHSLTRLYLRHSRIECRSEAWRYRGFGQLKKIDLDWKCLVHYEAPALSAPTIAVSVQQAPISSSPLSNIAIAASKPLAPLSHGPKLHHPALVDSMPKTIESVKVVDLEGEANLETIRWIFFRLVMMKGNRLPNLKIVIFVTPRKDCWIHAKDMCSRAGLKFPTYGVEKERKISGLDFVYA